MLLCDLLAKGGEVDMQQAASLHLCGLCLILAGRMSKSFESVVKTQGYTIAYTTTVSKDFELSNSKSLETVVV